jgi:signal peptidase I
MSDNPSDDRFSMPPIEGVWDGAEDEARTDDDEAGEPVARGLTLPPPGLFARLDDPEVPAPLEPEPVDADDVDDVEVADELEDHTAVLPPVARFDDDDDEDDEDDADRDARDRAGLSGVADAIDIVEQLAARAEAAERGPSGDDLVIAEAAEGIAHSAADEEDEDDVLDDDVAPIRLPSYAALGEVESEPEADLDAETETDLPAPITLPRYGDGERAEDEEEILPHFLLEESAPLDIVAAQEELREMAKKNRKRADDADEHRPTLARTLAEIPILLVVAAVIAFLVKTFLAQAYYIPSGSMLPQLQIDDRVVVSKLAYKVHDPRRGDIVVFDDPRTGQNSATEGDTNILRKIGEGVGVVQPSTDEFIKRVIGLPGERVSGRNGYVYINGHKLIEPYLPKGVETDDFAEQTVASGKLWVMGDNRNGSADSRVFGQIEIDSIVGRAVVKVWPFSHISFL